MQVDALLAEIEEEPAGIDVPEAWRSASGSSGAAAQAGEPAIEYETRESLAPSALPVAVEEAVPGERPTDLDDGELVELYRTMVRIRAFEEQVVDAYNARLVPGSTHPCIGQEASKVGAVSALGPDDLVLATYRGHGEAIALGVDPTAVMTELMAGLQACAGERAARCTCPIPSAA